MKKINFNKIILLASFLYVVSLSERLLYNHTNKATKDAYIKEKQRYKRTLEEYENKIFEDSVVVWSFDRDKRDSLRAILNPR